MDRFQVGTPVTIPSLSGLKGTIIEVLQNSTGTHYTVRPNPINGINSYKVYECELHEIREDLSVEGFDPSNIPSGRFVLVSKHKWLGQFLGYSTSKVSGLVQLVETAEVLYVPVDSFGPGMLELVPVGQVDEIRATVAQVPDHAGKNGYIPPKELLEPKKRKRDY